MKVTQKQLEDLFDLNVIDQATVAKQTQLLAVRSNVKLETLQKQVLELGQRFLEANKKTEAIDLELDRNNADLKLVEQRKKLDETRLVEAKNTKDVAGLQGELATLARRQNELEETSLELMEQQQQAQIEANELQKQREQVRLELLQLEAEIDSEIKKLQSAIALLAEDRKRTEALLPAELIERYQRKLTKSIPVGRLNGPQCGACQMTIASAEYSSLIAKPLDELIECPECSAILVRA